MSSINDKNDQIIKLQNQIRAYRIASMEDPSLVIQNQYFQQYVYKQILGLRKDIALQQVDEKYDLDRKIKEDKISIYPNELEQNFDDWMEFINNENHPIFIIHDDKELIMCPYDIYNTLQQIMDDYENG